MRNYELLFIISPNVANQDVDGLVDQVKDHVTSLGTTITNVENLGRRSLAYDIDHFQEGTYIRIQFQGVGDEIPELERRLRVMDNILRYLTVRLDSDLRRIERMKRKRAKGMAASAHTEATREALDEAVAEDEEESS